MESRSRRRGGAARVLLLAAFTTALWALPAHAERTVELPVTLRHNAPVSAGPVEPGFPIDVVGVVWDEGPGSEHHEHGDAEPPGAHGEVRLRHDGAWGPWLALVPDGADAPGQWSSALVAGRDADAFQVRGTPDHARGPRAVALNTTDGPKKVVARVPAGPQALSSCMSRAEWGADETLMTWTPEFSPAQVMTVHHTVTSNDDTDPAATVRAIYEYHAVDNGWGDIGYHYLVDQHGVVYEGRQSGSTSVRCDMGGTGADFAHQSTAADAHVVTAAHTGGSNTGNVGVAVLGDFTYHRKFANTPTSAAMSSLTDVLAELAHRHQITADVTRTYTNPVTGESRLVEAVSGHRDWKATECPGDNLYETLPDLRTAVAAEAAGMASSPSVSFSTPTDGATLAGIVPVAAETTGEVVSVDFRLNGTSVHLDQEAGDGWGFDLDTGLVVDGPYELSAEASHGGGTSAATIGVTVDNEPEAPATVTVSVVDLDAHTHGRGTLWDAHAVVAVEDSTGQPLSEAWVHGEFTGDGLSPTTASCQIDVTRCELHLDGLDKRAVSAVTFTVTDVVDTAGPYDPSSNSDGDGDSNAGTSIDIAP